MCLQNARRDLEIVYLYSQSQNTSSIPTYTGKKGVLYLVITCWKTERPIEKRAPWWEGQIKGKAPGGDCPTKVWVWC